MINICRSVFLLFVVPFILPLRLYSRSGSFCIAHCRCRSRSLSIPGAKCSCSRSCCSRCRRRDGRRRALGRRIIVLCILLCGRRHYNGAGALRARSNRTGRRSLRNRHRSCCRLRTGAEALCSLHGSHIRRTAWTTAFVRRRLRRISVRRICRCNRITIGVC